MDTQDRPTVDAVTAREQDLLTAIENVAARDALTEDDRHQLSFRAEILCEELRACIEGVEE
ncbi:hypothetical protein ACFPYI_02095 [Halomarina salina]|uniref:Uncharacterized protein n=1 Tax=Halomarina salina TaxID=1872699 RepID=A0ABD5RIE0_9EURY|nr:hypothetical protein [Halomarina salina]